MVRIICLMLFVTLSLGWQLVREVDSDGEQKSNKTPARGWCACVCDTLHETWGRVRRCLGQLRRRCCPPKGVSTTTLEPKYQEYISVEAEEVG